MIDRLSEPDPPRTVRGEIINILTVAGRPVTIKGVIERLRIGTAKEAKATLAALVESGQVVTVEVHGRPDCVTIPNQEAGPEHENKRSRAKRMREKIVEFLDEYPKTRVEIGRRFNISLNTVTAHIAELERAGMVKRLGMTKVPGMSQPQMLIKRVKDE